MFRHESCDEALGDTGSQDEHSKDTVSFAFSLGVAGLLHIIHNASNDLGAAMVHFDAQVDRLSVLAKFVRERHTQQRLLAKCFPDTMPGASQMREMLRTFHAHCYRNRWSTVARCALEMDRVLPALQSGWNLVKYMEAPDTHDVVLQQVNATIVDPFFEGYLRLLRGFGETVLHLISWAESCPCHWHLLKSHGWRASEASAEQASLLSCPFRGRRAAELAAGDFMQELGSLCSMQFAELSSKLPAQLTDAQRRELLHDYELGRSYLLTVFVLKLSHWQCMPWRAAALAYPEVDRARTIWPEVVYVAEHGTLHEKESLQVLLEEPVFSEGTLWHEGSDLCAVEHFMAVVGGLALTPTAERRIEGQHAKTQRASKKAPNHSPAYISVQLRSADMRWRACANPHEFVSTLAPLVHKCRTYKGTARQVLLCRHPAFHTKASRDKVLRDALYRADSHSMHMHLDPDSFRIRQMSSLDAEPGQALPLREGSPLGEMMRALVLEHVMQRIQFLREKEADGELIFACCYNKVAFSLLFQQLTQPQKLAGPGRGTPPQDVFFEKLRLSRASTANGGCGALGESSRLFFKLLPLALSRMNRLRSDRERSLRPSDLAITMLRPVLIDREAKIVYVDSSAMNIHTQTSALGVEGVPVVLSLSSLTLAQLNELSYFFSDTALAYVPEPSHCISQHISRHDFHQAISAVVAAGRGGLLHPQPILREALQTLVEHEIITSVPHKLLDRAQGLAIAHVLRDVKKVTAADPLPPMQQTRWQLLQTLEAEGWTVRVEAPRVCRNRPAYDHSAPVRDIFLPLSAHGPVCARVYLLALATASEHGKHVPHGAKADVYQHILQACEGVPPGLLRPSRPRFREVPAESEWLDAPIAPKRAGRPRRAPQRAVPQLHGALANHEAEPAVLRDVPDHEAEPAVLSDVPDHESEPEVLNDVPDHDAEPAVLDDEPDQAEEDGDSMGGCAQRSRSQSSSGSSSTSSNSRSSSSSSSSSSTSSCAAQSRPDDGPDPPAAPPPEAVQEAEAAAVVASEPEPDGGLGAAAVDRSLLETTFFWKGSRFTTIWGPEREAIGMEANCCHPDHRHCRRSLRYARYGGKEDTILCLKWWLLQARHHEDRESHIRTCSFRPDGPLPSSAELDRQELGHETRARARQPDTSARPPKRTRVAEAAAPSSSGAQGSS